MQYTLINIKNKPVIFDKQEAHILHSFLKTKQMPLLLPLNDTVSIKTILYGAVLHNEECETINHNKWLGYTFAYHQAGLFHSLSILDIHITATLVSGGLTFSPFAALVESDQNLAPSPHNCITAFLRFDDMDILTNVINRECIYALRQAETNPNITPGNWRKSIDDNKLMEIALSIS